MASDFTTNQLEAYLDEELSVEMMGRVEEALRRDAELGQKLAGINSRRDAGVHSLGEIWRRARHTCPSREQLGSYLLSALPEEVRDYIDFHLETIGCRFCKANLDDLDAQQASVASTQVESRRRKYFESSAAYLGKK